MALKISSFFHPNSLQCTVSVLLQVMKLLRISQRNDRENILIRRKICEQENYLNMQSSAVKVLVDPNIFVNLKLLRSETEKVKSKLWPCSGCIALRQGQSTFKSFLCEKRMINLLKIITCFKMVYDQFCHFKTVFTYHFYLKRT